MKRSALGPRPSPRSKQYEGTDPSAPRPTAPKSALFESMGMERISRTGLFLPTPTLKATDDKVRGQRIRESARGEPCLVRLPGICCNDPACTIWSHARFGAQLGLAGRGIASKALDILGAFACVNCDAAYDQLRGAGNLTRNEIDMAWLMGHLRSLARLVEKGIL